MFKRAIVVKESDMKEDLPKSMKAVKPLHDPTDRQSVRTTFKLSVDATEAMKWLKSSLRLSAKNVIESSGEELFERLDVLTKVIERDGLTHDIESLKEVFTGGVKRAADRVEFSGTRKAYVVSKGFVRKLNSTSKRSGFSRDALVDAAIVETYESNQEAWEDVLQKCTQALEILKKFNSAADLAETGLKASFGDNVHGNLLSIVERFDEIRVAIWLLLTGIKHHMEEDVGISNDVFDRDDYEIMTKEW
jgi:hypothetical protein